MGRPLPGFELRIVDDELQVRGRQLPDVLRPLPRRRAVRPGEWWSTGDVVSEDADGYLWYEGRNDDLILSAGYRIGPFEVESALLTHPAVAEAAAVAGARPRARLRSSGRSSSSATREPSDELARELQEHVKCVTAPYKYPRIVEFADELPKTASGKVKRAELRSSKSGPTGSATSGQDVC